MMNADRDPPGPREGVDVARSADRQLPHRAVVLAVVTLVLLAGASARGANAISASPDSSTHLGIQVAATLGALNLEPRSPHQVQAPGQPGTPAALPAVPYFALLVGLLLSAAAGSRPPLQVTQRRLPLRRGPPRDCSSRWPMTARDAPRPALLREGEPIMTALTHPSAAGEQLAELWRQQVSNIVALSRDTLPPEEPDGSRAIELLLANQLLNAGRQQLAETEAALARLKDGTYGVCEHCLSAINSERLEILPAARFCVACQARQNLRLGSTR